ncbi:MAG: hypothetical protein H6740_23310 [Alphaproteobacteria bacterium]|nr:hypothetical protein [Alphaproteobacteria bacterium]
MNLLLLLACKAPDPAPTEVEGLSHYLLERYDDEAPDALLDAADNLAAWYSAEVGEGDLGGTLGDLSREALDTMDMPPEVDPSEVIGIFHVTPQACAMDDVVAIFLNAHQDELFGGSYVAYERAFRGDVACFPPMDCERATWDVDITSEFALGIQMRYPLISGVRWASDGERAPVMLSRTHMPEPADADDPAYFDQSYQIEVLVPRGDDVLHLYALWNAGGVDGLDPEADFWKDQYLQGLIDYNQRIDELCATRGDWDR